MVHAVMNLSKYTFVHKQLMLTGNLETIFGS